jgi:hypothetical protein
MEEIWEDFEIITKEGAQLLNEGKRKIGKSWFDEECNDVISEREKARMKMINNNNIKNKGQNEKCRMRAKNVQEKEKTKHTTANKRIIKDNSKCFIK